MLLKRIYHNKPHERGWIVETPKGLGKVKAHEHKIHGKYFVYLDSGEKVIYGKDSFRIIGFFD